MVTDIQRKLLYFPPQDIRRKFGPAFQQVQDISIKEKPVEQCK
jgi:hypothetical protein